MKSSGIFWGSFIFSLGVCALISNMGWYDFQWGNFYKSWPVILIIWGLLYLNIPKLYKQILAGFSGIYTALLLMSIIGYHFGFCGGEYNSNMVFGRHKNFNSSEVHSSKAPIDTLVLNKDTSIQTCELSFEGGAGEFNISGGSDYLMYAINSNDKGSNVELNKENKDRAYINYSFDSENVEINNIPHDRFSDIKLNKNVKWKISMETGASSENLDLSELKVSELEVKTGVSKMHIKMGNMLAYSNVSINSGVSKIKLFVPKDAGVKIVGDMQLSIKKFNGFTQWNSDYYSEGYDKSKTKIDVNIDAGLSKIEVQRY